MLAISLHNGVSGVSEKKLEEMWFLKPSKLSRPPDRSSVVWLAICADSHDGLMVKHLDGLSHGKVDDVSSRSAEAFPALSVDIDRPCAPTAPSAALSLILRPAE